MSPTPTPIDLASVMSSGGHSLPVRKLASSNQPKMPPFLVEKIQPLVLASPEEQTDNWDDDFEDGISLSKLHCKLHLLFSGIILNISL